MNSIFNTYSHHKSGNIRIIPKKVASLNEHLLRIGGMVIFSLISSVIYAGPTVQSFDESGNYLGSSTSLPIQTPELAFPQGIGDVLNQFPNPGSLWGLEFKDGKLWGVQQQGKLYEMDPDTGKVLSTINISGYPSRYDTGLGWDSKRNNFVVTDPSADIFSRVNVTGGIVISFNTPGPGPVGAAYDSTRDGYWISDWEQDRVYLVDPDTGVQKKSLSVPAGASRIAGTGYDPINDVIMFHSRDNAKTYLMRADNGISIGVFPIPNAGINNGKGAAIRPTDQTGYLTHYEQPIIYVVDLLLAKPQYCLGLTCTIIYDERICPPPCPNIVIHGTNGDDVICGTDKDDIILGKMGHDTICGGVGDDVILADNGHDRVEGGPGNDVLDGGTGMDMLDGGPDNDVLLGGNDGDLLYGGMGFDYLSGGLGQDMLNGGPDNDICEKENNNKLLVSCESQVSSTNMSVLTLDKDLVSPELANALNILKPEIAK